jgi:hypothetical protein
MKERLSVLAYLSTLEESPEIWTRFSRIIALGSLS